MFLKNKYILILLFLISCQPVEIISPVEFDSKNYQKISINAKEIIVNTSYNSVFSEENIEDKIATPPIKAIQIWIENNINIFGNQNKLLINILDASIIKKEIDNLDANKYEEKTIFLYEVSLLLQFELYDDSDYLIANTTVETFRSITSKKYISLNETEIIVNELIFNAINDFTAESILLLNQYMSEYLK